MSEIINDLESTAFEFNQALKNYHLYSEWELYSYIDRIEKIVDRLLTNYSYGKLTDFKFRTINDLMSEYENVIKAIRENIESKRYNKARKLLSQLVTVVRKLNRNLAILSEHMTASTIDVARELEKYLGSKEVAEHLHEFDERVNSLGYVAREILTHIYNTPLKEVNIKDLPYKLGITGKDAARVISDAIDELRRKLPDYVDVVPDVIRGGYKVKLKV